MVQSIPAETEAPEIVSRDPATGEEIGRAPLTLPEEVARAVDRARAAQPAWAAKSFRQGGQIIMRARRIILRELDENALLISRTRQRPCFNANVSASYFTIGSAALRTFFTNRLVWWASSRRGIFPGRHRAMKWRWR